MTETERVLNIYTYLLIIQYMAMFEQSVTGSYT